MREVFMQSCRRWYEPCAALWSQSARERSKIDIYEIGRHFFFESKLINIVSTGHKLHVVYLKKISSHFESVTNCANSRIRIFWPVKWLFLTKRSEPLLNHEMVSQNSCLYHFVEDSKRIVTHTEKKSSGICADRFGRPDFGVRNWIFGGVCGRVRHNTPWSQIGLRLLIWAFFVLRPEVFRFADWVFVSSYRRFQQTGNDASALCLWTQEFDDSANQCADWAFLQAKTPYDVQAITERE